MRKIAYKQYGVKYDQIIHRASQLILSMGLLDDQIEFN